MPQGRSDQDELLMSMTNSLSNDPWVMNGESQNVINGRIITMNSKCTVFTLIWVLKNNEIFKTSLGLSLWCLMPLSTIF